MGTCITKDIHVQGIEKDITSDMFFPVGDHVSVGICVFQSGKQILLKSGV